MLLTMLLCVMLFFADVVVDVGGIVGDAVVVVVDSGCECVDVGDESGDGGAVADVVSVESRTLTNRIAF